MYQVPGWPQFIAQRIEYFTDLSVLSLVERGDRRPRHRCWSTGSLSNSDLGRSTVAHYSQGTCKRPGETLGEV
jgi:hypothetical protein